MRCRISVKGTLWTHKAERCFRLSMWSNTLTYTAPSLGGRLHLEPLAPTGGKACSVSFDLTESMLVAKTQLTARYLFSVVIIHQLIVPTAPKLADV